MGGLYTCTIKIRCSTRKGNMAETFLGCKLNNSTIMGSYYMQSGYPLSTPFLFLDAMAKCEEDM